jgi:hypothetical protein
VREQNSPSIADEIVEADAALRRVGRKIRRRLSDLKHAFGPLR